MMPLGTAEWAERRGRPQRDYSPVSWIEYFDEAHDISLESSVDASLEGGKHEQPTQQLNDSFRVYTKNFHEPFAPNREPGGSMDPSKLELSMDEINNYSKVPTLVALHGGGYSGLTWANFTKKLKKYCHFRMMAIDLRGHGDTTTSYDDKMDIEILVSDVIRVIDAAHRICGFLETPKVVLIGHSMGGAIAIKCASKCVDSLPSLIGFIILDVVEGTAKDALPMMMSVIKTRPTWFPTLSNAIEWSVRSGMTHEATSARVSMPGSLVNIASKQLSIHDILPENDNPNRTKMFDQIKRHTFCINRDQLKAPQSVIVSKPPLLPRVAALKQVSMKDMINPLMDKGTIVEERDDSGESQILPESDTVQVKQGEKSKQESVTVDNTSDSPKSDDYKKPTDPPASGYTWRTNLAKTQPHWNGWFDGLSAQLLDAPVQGKLILLAAIDRLDKPLMIGHMQGKFTMKVLPKCGHAVHEDNPESVASSVGDFLVRNKFTTVPTEPSCP